MPFLQKECNDKFRPELWSGYVWVPWYDLCHETAVLNAMNIMLFNVYIYILTSIKRFFNSFIR